MRQPTLPAVCSGLDYFFRDVYGKEFHPARGSAPDARYWSGTCTDAAAYLASQLAGVSRVWRQTYFEERAAKQGIASHLLSAVRAAGRKRPFDRASSICACMSSNSRRSSYGPLSQRALGPVGTAGQLPQTRNMTMSCRQSLSPFLRPGGGSTLLARPRRELSGSWF